MTELSKSASDLTQAHKIMSFTETILEDEFPIIRFAITGSGFTVIVLTVDIDDETDAFRYLYIPVSSKTEHEYRSSLITLRDIILKSPWLFLVDTDESGEPVKVYDYTPMDFPAEYLPLEGSFIPRSYLKTVNKEPVASFDLVVKLDGLVANRHMVETTQLNKISDAVTKHLTQSLSLLRQDETIGIYQKVPQAASFDIVFSLVQEKEQDAFLSFEKTCQIIEQILEYLTVDFIEEFFLFGSSVQNESKFKKLVSELFPELNTFYQNESELAKVFTKSIFHTGTLFSDLQFGNSYKSISFLTDGGVIGSIDGVKKYGFTKASKYYKDVLGLELMNEAATEYKILIYTLNTRSKKGKAFLKLERDPESKNRVVDFIIKEIATITHSKYTKALDSGDWIDVIGDLVVNYKGEYTLNIFHR